MIDFLIITILIFVHFWEEPLLLPRLTIYVPNHRLYTMYLYGNKYPKYKEERVWLSSPNQMPEVARGSHDYMYTYVLCTLYLDETIMVHGRGGLTGSKGHN